jgi:hypothetical protein
VVLLERIQKELLHDMNEKKLAGDIQYRHRFLQGAPD